MLHNTYDYLSCLFMFDDLIHIHYVNINILLYMFGQKNKNISTQ